jgi:MinD-like ATPase involved in chromosome partitioning or flagellar assembly
VSQSPRRRLLVNVDSPSGRHILEVPEDARIDDLVPSLVEACEGGSDPAGWSLAPLGEAILAGGQTLGERGLFPGAVLVLVAPGQPAQDEPKSNVPSTSDLVRRFTVGRAPSARMSDVGRMSDADYIRSLDAAIAAPRFGGSTVVAVMSAHAGAGTSTITFLLASLMSTLRTDEVGAVDARSQSAALSHWMAPESGLSAYTYRSLMDPQLSPEVVRMALVKVGRGLAILPAPFDQITKPVATEAAWGRIIEHLRHLHNIVILDCGAGFQHPAGRAALDHADQIVLVSKAIPGDLERLGPTIQSIRDRGRTVMVVANQATERARAKRSAQGLQEVTVAYEPLHAKRLKTRGFSWSDAPYSWQESIRELAAILIGSG